MIPWQMKCVTTATQLKSALPRLLPVSVNAAWTVAPEDTPLGLTSCCLKLVIFHGRVIVSVFALDAGAFAEAVGPSMR
jgi:hypothetical protein